MSSGVGLPVVSVAWNLGPCVNLLKAEAAPQGLCGEQPLSDYLPLAMLLAFYLKGKNEDGIGLHTGCGPTSMAILVGHGTLDLYGRALGTVLLFILVGCWFIYFKWA